MKALIRLLAGCACLLALVSQARAGEGLTPLQAAEKLQEVYNQTMTMSADFSQVTSAQMSRRQKLGSGALLIAKPGRIRWDYLQPDQQVLVSDGQKLHMYFAKSKQMIVSSAKEYLKSDVTYAFFAGTGNIARDFEVLAPDAKDVIASEGLYQVKLIPKASHPQVDYLNLWIDKEKFVVKRIQVVDKFGSVTDITFTNIRVNDELDGELFQFSPPEGTELIEK